MAESKPKGPAKAPSKDVYAGAKKATGIGPDPYMEGGRLKTVGAGHLEIPGVRRAANWAADKIDPPLGEGGYARGALAGGIQGLGNFLSTGADPANVTPGHAPMAATRGAAGDLQQLVQSEAKPLATFLGWQRGLPEQGIPHVPLYSVHGPGHPLHGSTVSPQTLVQHGIQVPPPPQVGAAPPAQLGGGTMMDAQGMQMPKSYFNKSAQGASAVDPMDSRMDNLVKKFGGRGR